VNQKVTDCSHSSVTCINPYEIIRKYECAQCGGVMMCACEEAFGRRHLPHQISKGSRLSTRERVPVTLGFQPKICNHCRGLLEQAAPKAALPGKTSKVHRYYWREIFMRKTDRFAEWAERTGISYRPGLQFERTYQDVLKQIEREVVDEIKAEHEYSPKYQYQEKSSDKVLPFIVS